MALLHNYSREPPFLPNINPEAAEIYSNCMFGGYIQQMNYFRLSVIPLPSMYTEGAALRQCILDKRK